MPERVGVSNDGCPLPPLRGETGDYGDPRQRQGEQDQDAGDREQRQHSRPGAEAHEQADRAIGMDWNRSKMPLFISRKSRNAV
jgi:hypothetical protein